VQLRVRVRQDLAARLLALKPRTRGKLVSAGIGAVLNGCDSIATLSGSLEQLRKIGTNLNQLTYLANTGKLKGETELGELRSLLTQVKQIVG
jgi:hypothetical protein